MTTTHTPGPWAVIEEDCDFSIDGEGWFDGQKVKGWVIVGNPDDPNMAIAVIDTGAAPYWDDERLDANARLIAAAPDLLSALRAILAEADTMAMTMRRRAVFEAGCAAIAKAEGR
jgi:hypothetical protein